MGAGRRITRSCIGGPVFVIGVLLVLLSVSVPVRSALLDDSAVSGLAIQGKKIPWSKLLQHKSGDLFVPFSSLADVSGLIVLQDYQGRVYRLKYKKHVVLLSPNVFAFNVDGTGVSLSNAPRIIEEELYIPIKPIARALGLKVSPYQELAAQVEDFPGSAVLDTPPIGKTGSATTDELITPKPSQGKEVEPAETPVFEEMPAVADDPFGAASGFGGDDDDEYDSVDDDFGFEDEEALVRVSLYSEMGSQDYDTEEVLNRNNRMMFNRFRFYNRGFLTIKSSFGETASGFLQLEGLYIPVDFYLNSFKNGSTGLLSQDISTRESEVSIKALYIDQVTRYFTLRLGKQFLKWGSSTFFTPLDVINYEQDPLRPIEEAEGNPFIHLTFPFAANFSVELLGIVLPDDTNEKTESVGRMPIVPKISLSMGNVSLFAFSKLQQDNGPIHGFDLNCVFPVGEYSDLTLYTQALLKPQTTDRVRFVYDSGADVYKPMPMDASSYRSWLGGLRFQHTFTELDWLEGLNFAVEYYYDNENWEKEDYQNYLKYLEQEETRFAEVFGTYNIFANENQFRNSTRYLFGNLTFQSIFKEDFRAGMSLVLNVDDSSYLMIPDISYSFSNNNATTGLKANIFRGDDDNEFGSLPLEHQVFYYLSYTY